MIGKVFQDGNEESIVVQDPENFHEEVKSLVTATHLPAFSGNLLVAQEYGERILKVTKKSGKCAKRK